MLKYFSNAVPNAVKGSHVGSKSETSTFHSNSCTALCLHMQGRGTNILGHHTSAAPWLLCGHISLTSSLSPRLKKPPDQQPPPVSSQRPREMLQSQTEPCTSVAFPTCSIHCVPQDTSPIMTRDRRCSFLPHMKQPQLHSTHFPFLLQHSYFCF